MCNIGQHKVSLDPSDSSDFVSSLGYLSRFSQFITSQSLDSFYKHTAVQLTITRTSKVLGATCALRGRNPTALLGPPQPNNASGRPKRLRACGDILFQSVWRRLRSSRTSVVHLKQQSYRRKAISNQLL